LFAAIGILTVSAAPWFCAWAELSAGSLLVATVSVQTLWLLIWTRWCKAEWECAAQEPICNTAQQTSERYYPCGADGVYS
jgi:hypothetical protein